MRSALTRSTLLAAALLVDPSPRADAATFYWDGATVVANTASGGGTGTWTVGSAGWEDGTSAVNWSNTNDAIFGGTAGTVSLGGAISAGSITLNTAGYIFNQAGFNLSLTNFAGSGATTFSGTGTVSISGASSGYSGAITLGSGFNISNILSVGSSTSLGSGTLFMRGGLLQASASSVNLANAINVGSGGFRMGGTNSFTLSGAITMDASSCSYVNYSSNGSTLTLAGATTLQSGAIMSFDNAAGAGSGAPIVVSGAISGAGTIAKIGLGLVTLTGNNTFTGNITVSSGTLKVTGPSGSLYNLDYSNTPIITVSTGGTLELDSFAYGAAGGLGQLSDYAARRVLSGGTINIAGSTQSSGNNFNVASGSTGSFNMTTAGQTLTLSGNANDNINVGGVLTFGGAGNITVTEVIGNLTTAGSVVYGGSGTLALNGANTLTGSLTANSGTVNVGGSFRSASGITANTGSIINLNAEKLLVSGHGTIVDNSVVLTANGSGVLVFGNAEFRIGNVTLNNGGTVTSNRALSAWDILLANTTTGAATVNVTGTAISAALINGTGGIRLQGVQNFAVADITTSSANDLVVSAVLGNPGNSGGDNGGINKTGLGTMLLSNAGNNFSGALTVNAGTLIAQGVSGNTNTALGQSSGSRTVTVNSGATLALSGANVLGGGSQTLANTIKITVNGGTLTTNDFSVIGNVDLNGGIMTATAGNSGSYQTYEFNGSTVTVGGSAASTMSSSAASNGGYHLGGSRILTLVVADVTTSSATDLTISAALLNGSGDRTGAGALLKTGEGTVLFSASNTYTGGLTHRAGTIIASNSGGLGSGTVTLGDASTGSSNIFLNLNATSAEVSIARNITVAANGTGTVTLGSASSANNNIAAFTGALTLNRAVTLNGGSAGDRLGFSGGVGGTADIIITGTNRVVFSGTANSFAGSTTINSGSTLQLSDGSATANSFLSDSHALVVNGTLRLAKGTNNETVGALSGSGIVNNIVGGVTSTLSVGGGNSTATFNGVLANPSGVLALTKTGSGTQTLTATQTYTGATTISAGVLNVTGSLSASSAVSVASSAALAGSGSAAGSVTVANGGILTPGVSGFGTLTLGSLNLGSTSGDLATINIGVAGSVGTAATSSLLQVNGALVTNGGVASVTFALGNNLANLNTGTYNLINYSGTQLSVVDAFTWSGTKGGRQDVSIINGTGAIQLGVTAAFPIWTGSNTDWSAANGSWRLNSDSSDTSFLADDSVRFDDTATAGAVNLTADVTSISISFASETLAYTVGSSGGFGITSGQIVKAGAGTLTINNANTFAGGTTVSGGDLVLGNNAALGTGTIALNAGSLNLNGRTVDNDIVLGGGTLISNNAILTGDLSETGSARALTIASSLTLQGAVSYTGATTINSGTLELGGSGQLGAGAYAGAIVNSDTLKINSTANQTLSGIVSGSGTLVKDNSGTLTLTGDNTFSGSTTITAGSLVIGGSGRLGSGVYAQTIANEGTLRFNTSSNQTLSGVVSGAGALIKDANASLVLSAVNTFTGDITIGGGSLQVSGAGQLAAGSYAGAIANAGTLAFTSSANQSLSGIVSGVGLLTKSGSSTLTLSNTNTFSGGTTLTGGTLAFANGSLGSSGTVTVNGGVLQWASGNTQDVSSRLALAVSGAATLDTNGNNVTLATGIGNSLSSTLTKTGAGILTLNSLMTHTGATVVNNGTLRLGFAANSGITTPSITVNSGGTLEITTQDGIFYTVGRAALVINGGTVTIASGVRATIANTITMTGGTLAGTGSGDTFANYSLFNSGITATSDAQGNAATISAARLALQDSGTQNVFNVTRGAASPATDLSVTGTIVNMNSSTSGLNKTGNGVMTVSGTNTYIGGTTITAGNLVVASAGGLSTGAVNLNGGTLTLGTAVTGVGATTFTSGTLAGSGSLAAASFALQSGTLNAVLAGNGALTKSTAGSATLSAANTFTGGTTIAAGTLVIGVSNALVSGSAITMTGGTLVGPGSGSLSLAPSSISITSGDNSISTQGNTSLVIAGSGGVSVSGSAIFRAGGSHTYSGETSIAGTARLELSGGPLSMINSVLNVTSTASNSVDIWSGKLTVRGLIGTGIVLSNGSSGNDFYGIALSIVTPTDESYTFAGQLRNATWSNASMAIEKMGAGTQALTGNNVYSGGTTLAVGTLAAGSNTALGTGAIALNGGTLSALGANARTLANNLTIGAHSTLGNATNNGALTLSGTVNLGSTARTLTIDSAVTLSGVLSGAGAFTKSGNGTLTLSGLNTYSGGTILSAGTLVLGQLGSFGSGTVLVSGGILDLNNLAPTNIITLSGGSLLNASTWAATGVIQLSGNLDASFINDLPGEVMITAGATINLTGVTKDIVFEGGSFSNLADYQGKLKVKGNLDLSAGGPAGEIEVTTGGTVAFGNATSSRAIKFTGGSVTGANFTGDIEVVGSNIALGSGIQAGRVRLTAGNSATISNGFNRDIDFAGGSLAGLTNYSGTVSLETGATLTVDDTTGASFSLASGSTLKGDGTIDSLTQASGSILAPGNSPGLLTTSTFAPEGGAIMEVEFYDPSGFAGTGYDAVATSTLDLSNLDTANRYILKLISLSGLPSTEGPLNGFDASQTYAFDVFTYATLLLPAAYAGGIAGLFTIDLTRFQDGAGVFVTQGFTLSDTGSALVLNYAPIPEPSTYGLILGGLALAGAAIRRRKQKSAK